MQIRLNIMLLVGMMVLMLSGCATSKQSGFLSGYDRLHRGRYLESYWSGSELNRQTLSNIYIESIDISRAKDHPSITLAEASNSLRAAIVSSLQAQRGWSTADQPEKSTSRLSLAITQLNPGSAGGRMLAGELGMGHAFIQIEGKLVDSGTGTELACFADRRRDSGAIGLEDLGGDAGPRLVKRMIEKITSDFVKELSLSVQ